MQVRAIDQDGLQQVEQWLAADPVGGAIFGGFYGHAVARWTPLLAAPSRHGWLTFDESGPIGFIDLEILDEEAETTYYVSPTRRGQGLGRPTVDHVIQLATDLGAHQIHASVDADNAASLALLRSTGFTDEGPNEFDEIEFTLVLDSAPSAPAAASEPTTGAQPTAASEPTTGADD